MWNAEKGVWEGDQAPASEGFELPDPLWLFGYGSLCWKNGDFPFVRKENAIIKGFKRRFHQKSYILMQ